MGFKLFKSTEDQMKDAMFSITSPVGKDIRQLLAGNGDYYMGDYKSIKMYERPLRELLFLKEKLRTMGIGLAVCEDAGYFFADPIQVVRFRSSLQQTLDRDGDDSGFIFVQLIKHFWTNKIPIASVHVFMEGFEVQTFVDGEKVKKELVRKPLLF